MLNNCIHTWLPIDATSTGDAKYFGTPVMFCESVIYSVGAALKLEALQAIILLPFIQFASFHTPGKIGAGARKTASACGPAEKIGFVEMRRFETPARPLLRLGACLPSVLV
jgi:hypothetical protein